MKTGFATEQGNRSAGSARGYKQKPCETRTWQADGTNQPVVVAMACESRQQRRGWVVGLYSFRLPVKTGMSGRNKAKSHQRFNENSRMMGDYHVRFCACAP